MFLGLCFKISSSNFFTSMFPLNENSDCVSFDSVQGISMASAPENSMLARVVSKCVLLIKNFPFPPKYPYKIRSAARP